MVGGERRFYDVHAMNVGGGSAGIAIDASEATALRAALERMAEAHRRTLDQLSSGVAVYGAASMGALRAAECEAFGMVPVGDIARRYCSGALFDDADVALTNGPAELGFPPLTEAMVDVDSTVSHLADLGLVTPAEAAAIIAAARSTFFADRTAEAIFERLDHPRAAKLGRLYATHRVSQKTRDALELLDGRLDR